MNSDKAASVIDLFYRHQIQGTSPLIEGLGSAGGFSGARIWRITDDLKEYCLRRWPSAASQNERRLRWSHRQLSVAYDAGCRFVPVPLPGVTRETLVEHGDHLWQLEPWMPGVADFADNPSLEKLGAAMQTLARFHSALRTGTCRKEASPGILMRMQSLARLFDGKKLTRKFLEIESASSGYQATTEFANLAASVCARFRTLSPPIYHSLNRASQKIVEIQTVITDIHRDHVYYEGDKVSAIVDFGAMDMDSPARDVARLLGSMAGDDVDRHKAGLQSYLREGILSKDEIDLLEVFDTSTTLMAGINWLQWICLENREFGNLKPILGRLSWVARRMDFMASSL